MMRKGISGTVGTYRDCWHCFVGTDRDIADMSLSTSIHVRIARARNS